MGLSSKEVKEYKSLIEWKKDVKIFRKHPNDMVFFDKMKERLEKSSEEVRREIEDYEITQAFRTNPMIAMEMVQKRYPNKIIVIKNKEDIFFEA